MTLSRFVPSFFLATFIATSSLLAQTWTGATSGSLGEATNWTDNTLPANDGTAALSFGSATNYTLSIDTSMSVNSLSFTSAATAGYTFNGTGSATITVGSGGISNTSGRDFNSNHLYTIALPQNITFHVSSATTFANWSLSGSGGITKTGAGKVYMGAGTGNNLNWTGSLTINQGTVTFNNDNKLGTVPTSATPNLIILNGGTFNPSSTITINSNRGIAVTAASTITAGSTVTYGGIMTGSSALTLTGGTLALSGANTYSGTLTIGSTGTLRLNAASTLADATINISTGSLTFGTSATTIGALSGSRPLALTVAGTGIALTLGNNHASTTYSGVISGTSGRIIKTGTGTFTLSAASTYTGGTTVNAGTLKVSNSTGSATGTGAVTINSGAKLSGTGRISGATTLNSGATISPGNSPGTLTTGSQTWAGGANYIWEINDATGTSGTNYDLLSISGTLTINATSSDRFTLSLVSLLANNSAGEGINFNAAQNYTYTIATTTGGILGFDASAFTLNTAAFANALNGGTWSLALANSNQDLTLNFTAASAIPEPSTYAALFGATVLSLALLRRRKAGL